jgi:wyosine [tRNA(Phe)-imidazoG37] synthetase (radical SAM superfamily)
VPSRRLGFSLGIDIIPHKNCSFDCIYCQLGKTTNKTLLRRDYTPAQEILEEVACVLQKRQHIDYLTFSGSGEPTLHKDIGYLINQLHNLTEIPIAVLTNGSLMFLPDVQNDLVNADVVLPTLCAVEQKTFSRIHRNHVDLNVTAIISGLVKFREMYKGEIWLEFMLIKGINDQPGQITQMKSVIEKIKPDKIHLNTVVRPPSEEYATPVSADTLREIKRILGNRCEIIADFRMPLEAPHQADHVRNILSIAERRPVTVDDLVSITGLHVNEILKYIERLLKQGKIVQSNHEQKKYYRSARRFND